MVFETALVCSFEFTLIKKYLMLSGTEISWIRKLKQIFSLNVFWVVLAVSHHCNALWRSSATLHMYVENEHVFFLKKRIFYIATTPNIFEYSWIPRIIEMDEIYFKFEWVWFNRACQSKFNTCVMAHWFERLHLANVYHYLHCSKRGSM